MNNLGKIKLSNGAVINMEYTPENNETYTNRRTPASIDTANEAIQALDFGEVVQTVTALANDLKSVIKQTQSRKVAVEFGIQIGLETGGVTSFFVKGSGTANLKITIEWQTTNEVSIEGTATRKDLSHIPNE